MLWLRINELNKESVANEELIKVRKNVTRISLVIQTLVEIPLNINIMTSIELNNNRICTLLCYLYSDGRKCRYDQELEICLHEL
jgi:hypothetical protein